MNVIDIERRTNAKGMLSVHCVGDTHLDSAASDHARIRAHVKAIAADPHSVAIFAGDLLEGRVPGRKHFDLACVRHDFLGAWQKQGYANYGVEVAVDLFRPLVKARVPFVVVAGNHDDYFEEVSISAMLVKALGGSAHYMGPEGFVRVRSGRGPEHWYTTTIYCQHGYGGGRAPGSKINNLQRTFEWVDADIVVAGHVHDGNIRVIPSVGVQRRGEAELVESDRVMYRAPGYVLRTVRGVATYASRKGYPSADYGIQWVKWNPEKRKALRVELDLHAAA